MDLVQSAADAANLRNEELKKKYQQLKERYEEDGKAYRDLKAEFTALLSDTDDERKMFHKNAQKNERNLIQTTEKLFDVKKQTEKYQEKVGKLLSELDAENQNSDYFKNENAELKKQLAGRKDEFSESLMQNQIDQQIVGLRELEESVKILKNKNTDLCLLKDQRMELEVKEMKKHYDLRISELNNENVQLKVQIEEIKKMNNQQVLSHHST